MVYFVTQGEIQEDLISFAVFCAEYALVFVQFVCVLFADTSALDDHPLYGKGAAQLIDQDIDERSPFLQMENPMISSDDGRLESVHPSPELSASFLSRIIFFWFTEYVAMLVNAFEHNL